MSNKKRILVIGQTPPPYMGQALMTQRLVDANFEGIEIHHIRMAFSRSISSIGKFEIGKVVHMLSIVWQAWMHKLKYGTKILYYMPAGPNLVPVVRDIFILTCLRLFYAKVIFHFRAAGLSDFLTDSHPAVRWIGKRVYGSPSLAIHLSHLNPDDGGYFKAKEVRVIPNGLEDAALTHLPIVRETKPEPVILFVGVLKASKGIMVLLETAAILRAKGHSFHVWLMGEFDSISSKETFLARRQSLGLEETVELLGVKKGEEKWPYFAKADIFCFPSYFESESFGNVLVEAMMFELPIVTTYWRGIPSIVQDQKHGFLVPVKDPEATAMALGSLIDDPALRETMGKEGRNTYCEDFQLEGFIQHIEEAFEGVS